MQVAKVAMDRSENNQNRVQQLIFKTYRWHGNRGYFLLALKHDSNDPDLTEATSNAH